MVVRSGPEPARRAGAAGQGLGPEEPARPARSMRGGWCLRDRGEGRPTPGAGAGRGRSAPRRLCGGRRRRPARPARPCGGRRRGRRESSGGAGGWGGARGGARRGLLVARRVGGGLVAVRRDGDERAHAGERAVRARMRHGGSVLPCSLYARRRADVTFLGESDVSDLNDQYYFHTSSSCPYYHGAEKESGARARTPQKRFWFLSLMNVFHIDSSHRNSSHSPLLESQRVVGDVSDVVNSPATC